MTIDTEDALGARIQEVTVDTPGSLTTRVLATVHNNPSPQKHRRSTRRRIAYATAVATSFLSLNVAAIYFVPKYAEAMANIPIAKQLLQESGLSPKSLTLIGDSVDANGHKVVLVAGGADEVRTTLFMSIDGQTLTSGSFFHDMSLTDQFGSSYHIMSGGSGVYNFEPLRGLAAGVGARLTVHLGGIYTAPPLTCQSDPKNLGSFNPGNWELHAVLNKSTTQTLPLPKPISLSATTWTFTKVTASDAIIDVAWSMTGGSASDFSMTDLNMGPVVPKSISSEDARVLATCPAFKGLQAKPGSNAAAPPVPTIKGTLRLYAPDGHELIAGTDNGPLPGPTGGEVWYPSAGSGNYRLVITDPSGPSVERTLTVS